MTFQYGEFLIGVARRTVAQVAEGFALALPRLVAGLVFFTLAYVGIRIALAVVRRTLDRLYADSHDLVVNLFVTVTAVFLWFGVALTLLKIVGMGDIAASLGTATGFIALGISYALSNMIADTVAGVYLLRDPDFAPGMRVSTDSVSGTVRAIELRKSRIETDDGDTVVLANRDIEKKWTRKVGVDTGEPV